ncbi:hypothetical protein COSMO_23 [Mycobacterium phage Cosmo]|uniref:Uncharacterized protein n=1 Tax=Mycobacterium phage Cosmo TaxID=1567467 RepID=A0A0B5A346_9CAUD|nr:hypothetical protein COSMO_23 [Mycobacterium phage Cosmo]
MIRMKPEIKAPKTYKVDPHTAALADEYGIPTEKVEYAMKAIDATPELNIEMAINGQEVKGATLRVSREFDNMGFLNPNQAIIELVGEDLRAAIVVDRKQLSDQLTKEIR